MRALHQALGLRVRRPADDHLGAQRAPERLALGGELAAAAALPADRALAVPDQHPRHRTQPRSAPPAGRQVLRPPGRDQPAEEPPRIPRHHRQHRQLLRGAGLPEPDRQRDRREPEIALGDLPGHIRRARRRVRRQIHRPQLPTRPDSTGSTASSRSAPRSPSPASSDTPSATPESAAPPHPQWTLPLPAHTSAVYPRRSPCTVFLETPNTRAICLDRQPLDRCNLRISAQSSTYSTLRPPWLGSSQSQRKGSKFR